MTELKISTSEWMTTAVETMDDGSLRAQPVATDKVTEFLGDRWVFVNEIVQSDRIVRVYARRPNGR
jgi:hypothetical protein